MENKDISNSYVGNLNIYKTYERVIEALLMNSFERFVVKK